MENNNDEDDDEDERYWGIFWKRENDVFSSKTSDEERKFYRPSTPRGFSLREARRELGTAKHERHCFVQQYWIC